MNQTPYTKPSASLRICSLLAAAAVTTVLVGSQLGIAEGYNWRADVLLAARHVEAVAHQSAASAAHGPRS